MGQTWIDRIEGFLVRFPRWSIPFPIAGFVARALAPLGSALRRNDRSGMEARLRGFLSTPRFRVRGLRLGRGITIEGRPRITLEDGVTLWGDVFLNATGPRGRIEIGARTHIDRQTVLYGQGGIRIGRGCAVASSVIMYTQSNQYDRSPETPILEQGTRYGAVEVGDDVWIGAGAILLPGVKIGDHAVVAAGAVVRRNVEPWMVVAGVPAEVIKDRRAAR